MKNYSNEAREFLDHLFSEVRSKNIVLEFKEVDHICFRTESEEDYLKTCKDFSSLGELLIEAPVNGRLISTYKLHRPIEYHHLTIPLVEVPAPKKGRKTLRGFEHIELVVEEGFEVLIERYKDLKLEKGALQKALNPELEIELEAGSIKFHHLSLEEVIRIEKATFQESL